MVSQSGTRHRRGGDDEYRQGYAKAGRAVVIGQAVRERRLAWACLRSSWPSALA
jgi:hypothetical protein